MRKTLTDERKLGIGNGFINITVRTIRQGCYETKMLNFKTLLKPCIVRAERIVLTGKGKLYLKLSPLPKNNLSGMTVFILSLLSHY